MINLLATLSLAVISLSQGDAGPILGDLTETGVRVLYCGTDATPLQLRVLNDDGQVTHQQTITPEADQDHCVQWRVNGLTPGRRYDYQVFRNEDQPLAASSFTTAAPMDARVPTSVGFGSCADEGEGSSSVWDRIRLDKVDAMVLLGDTPYIDTTELATQRSRNRIFAQVPGFARLAREIPIYATWDDHDFGRNDTDGNLPGKENSRQAFLEYHPNPSAGHDDQGIYTNFRVGELEVFLLDARWFARTMKSPFAEDQPTLLGERQWQWLREKLASSTATFKAITTGMIFNGSVRPFKTDYWAHYPHELDALYRLIGELEVSGVVLVGGDIHRQRIVRHDTREVAGYDLIEFISSPIHHKIIDSANQPHPGLLYDSGEINMYVQLEGDPGHDDPVLTSQFITAGGRMLDVRNWRLSQFTPKAGE